MHSADKPEPFGPTLSLAPPLSEPSALTDGALPEHLTDVAEGYEYLKQCREREMRAKVILVALIRDARDEGAKLDDIAAQMGVTRQYVQKLIREAERAEARDEEEARRYEPDNAKRRLGRSSGWRDGTPQCSGCKRFLKTHDDICPSCGYAGHGGYVGVPAQTSYLERWR